MKRACLLSVLILGACGGGDPTGSYDGTLTLTLTTGSVVVSAFANLQPDQDNVEVISTSITPDVHCYLQGTSWSGSAVHFDCATHQCWCDVDTANLTVTTATGGLDHDLLTLSFAGEASGGAAFSAGFTGALEPGTQ